MDALVRYIHARSVGGVHGREFLVIPPKIKGNVYTLHLKEEKCHNIWRVSLDFGSNVYHISATVHFPGDQEGCQP